jgi:4'-phosphopantetheinyl transferase
MPLHRIDLWWSALDWPKERLAAARGELDPDEKLRVERFTGETQRSRFVAAHAATRRVLARYVGVAPAALKIARDPCRACGALHGKPRLANSGTVHFNASHSDALVAIAVAQQPVGVDVEPCARSTTLADIEDAVVGPWEPPAGDPAELLRIWVRKEAALKLTGLGLTARPAEVTIERRLGPWRYARAAASGGAYVRDVELPLTHVAAVAVRVPGRVTVRAADIVDG